jgi:hypothetical protein
MTVYFFTLEIFNPCGELQAGHLIVHAAYTDHQVYSGFKGTL